MEKDKVVYSWRLSPHLKRELEHAARVKRKSMAELLEEIALEWLERFRDLNADAEDRQRVLHEAGMKFVGSIHGDDPNRAANVRTEVRARLRKTSTRNR